MTMTEPLPGTILAGDELEFELARLAAESRTWERDRKRRQRARALDGPGSQRARMDMRAWETQTAAANR